MKKYINLKNLKGIFIFALLLTCTSVTLARSETRTMNYNLNRSLDLRAMAEINEQILSEYTAEEPVTEQQPTEIRQERAMSHTQDDLFWLALAIHYEAGSNWLSDEHQLKVGNVIINRMASNRFRGTTVYEIVHQQGQYPWATRTSHATPSERSVRNAQRLLNGERILPDNVIWQANFRQGTSCYSIIPCPRGVLRTTFFCY